jgi:hypothetical protein
MTEHKIANLFALEVAALAFAAVSGMGSQKMHILSPLGERSRREDEVSKLDDLSHSRSLWHGHHGGEFDASRWLEGNAGSHANCQNIPQVRPKIWIDDVLKCRSDSKPWRQVEAIA